MSQGTMLMMPWVNGDGVIWLRELHEDGPRGARRMDRLLAPNDERPILIRVVTREGGVENARGRLSRMAKDAPDAVRAYLEGRPLPESGLAEGFAIENQVDALWEFALRSVLFGTRFCGISPGGAGVQSLALDLMSGRRRLDEMRQARIIPSQPTCGGYPEFHPDMSAVEYLLAGEPRVVLVSSEFSFAQ